MDEFWSELAKTGEPESHRRRVAAFTIAVAKGLGLKKEEIRVIARGAFLHDIGCAGLPQGLLQRKGRFTSEESTMFRKHCEMGRDMLAAHAGFADSAEIAYAHHEHYDGSGYPRGLKAIDISIGARIFAVPDRLDDIMMQCSHNAVDIARENIEAAAGKEFDPEVVQAFLETPVAVWEQLRSDIDSTPG